MTVRRRFHWLASIVLFTAASLVLSVLFASPGPSLAARLALAGTPTSVFYFPLIARQSTPTPRPTSTGVPIPPDDLANEQYIVNQINAVRVQNGLAPLNLVSELTQAARGHSRDMADNNFTSHTGSDGSNGGQRMQRAGYNWVNWAEIIGWGFQGDPAKMMDWWMNSPVHKATILSTFVADFGAGYSRNANSTYVHYWTVNFGKRVSSSVPAHSASFVCQHESVSATGGSSVMSLSPIPCF